MLLKVFVFDSFVRVRGIAGDHSALTDASLSPSRNWFHTIGEE